MSTIPFLCCFLVLLPLSFSLGRCSNISFSLCWFSNKEDAESKKLNIWLNETALGSIGDAGGLTSLTVPPSVKNIVSLQYGDKLYTWAFNLHQRSKHFKIGGVIKPKVRPTNETQSVLQSLRPSEVFACENSTLYFLQFQGFFMAVGYSTRLPVTLESRRSDMLLLSWKSSPLPSAPDQTVPHTHSAVLFGLELKSFTPIRLENSTNSHHRFTGLDSCSSYVACVQMWGTKTLTCLNTITDPEKPGDLQVWWANSSSLALIWDCPENRKYSMFLLTVFHHQGASHSQPEEQRHWIREPLEWTVSDLAPCARLSFGLQTVCSSGTETRYSPMVLHRGNSDLSNVLNLLQSSLGPDHYSLSWGVSSHSSVSKFRVFHDGEEKGTTLKPSFTVSGLQPCRSHTATVQALCGENTLMDTRSLQVHTGARGVSDLRFIPEDDVVMWTPGTASPHLSFIFKVFRDDGGDVLWSGRVSEPRLPMSGLKGALSYRLSVWEECEEQRQSPKSTVEFTLADEGRGNISSEVMVRAARTNGSRPQEGSEDMNEIPLTVPWILPKDFQDQTSHPWAEMASLLQDRMVELLSDYHSPVYVELMSSGPAEEPGHTHYRFSVFKEIFNKSTGELILDQPLWIRPELEYVWSPDAFDLSIRDGAVHWDGPDLCLPDPCPQNSLCLNTLGSFSCVCRQDHYDVSAFINTLGEADSPVCNDKGLFSRCLDRQLVGGMSKLFLHSRLQGALQVSLNQDQCPVNETEDFYYFKTTRNGTLCGTKRVVNESHIELQNSLTVTAGAGVRRRHMRALLRCVYPRLYLRSALLGLDLDWVSSVSVVAYNSSLQLGLSMNLFRDSSFSSSYSDTVMLGPEDTLFFEVSLHTSHSFIQDVRLQVETCWATESPDPHDQAQGMILQDGCPADDTFSWLLENGSSQRSRFSLQMFKMPLALPLYFHCRAAVCNPDDNCTKSCSDGQRRKRALFPEVRAVVVSAGPLVVKDVGRTTMGKDDHWAERMTVITVVSGTLGFLFLTLLFVSTSKAVLRFYRRLRLQ